MHRNPLESSISRLEKISSSTLDHLISVNVVRSGTSRIIVADQRSLPRDMKLDEVANHLLGHGDPANGLGGEHYQLNKVAIWNPSSEDVAEFHFFSLDPSLRTITSGSECGHAAAAVGMVAAISEPDRFDPSSVPIRSLDTNQRFEYRAHDTTRFWNATCTLELTADTEDSSIHSETLRPGHRAEIRFDVVLHGNSFALVSGMIGLESSDIRRAIVTSTSELAGRNHRVNCSEEYVRIIPYEIEWQSETAGTVIASCFNGEARHKSLPISGAIALCDCLALKRVAEHPPADDVEDLNFSFMLESPHSTKPGGVRLVRRDGAWVVERTGYDADIRLLFSCQAIIPLQRGC